MLFQTKKSAKPNCISAGIYGICIIYGKSW